MVKHTNAELEQNYKNFLSALSQAFSGERLDKLLKMYSMEELGPNLLLSPASGNKNYHNAYEGGYIDHVINVVQNSLSMLELYKKSGGKMDFTQDELLFAAFHHDLGKLGDVNMLNYVANDSTWHVTNRGEIYKRNPELTWMTLTDRTFYLLSKYGITYTENEYFGIKLTDGMYDEDNVKYLKSYDTSKGLKSNIQFILHWADHMSTCIERDQQFR